jgi:putative transposase
MKQRHSFTDLLFHVVLGTKNREHLILSEGDENALYSDMRAKAHDLDAWIEEIGGWREHVHLLVRTRPTTPLSDVYGQIKGFSSWSWRKRWPMRPFGWSDGVWAMTVDPLNSEGLRAYILEQRRRHDQRALVADWEPGDPSPPGLAGRPS